MSSSRGTYKEIQAQGGQVNAIAQEEKFLGADVHSLFHRRYLLQSSGDLHCARHVLRTGVGALMHCARAVVSQRCTWRARTLRTMWAVGNDVTQFLATITSHPPSPTARKSVYGAAVSYRTFFLHVSAQIGAHSNHRGDLLCTRARHGCEHPRLARLAEHVDQKINFFVVGPLLQTVAAVKMASRGHNCVVQQTEKLHEIPPRRLKAPHVVRKGVLHLKDLALIRSFAKSCKQVEKS